MLVIDDIDGVYGFVITGYVVLFRKCMGLFDIVVLQPGDLDGLL